MTSIVTVTTPRTDGGLLVTLDALKAELQITSSDTDDYLTAVLARASSVVEAYCKRVFAIETVSEVFRFRFHSSQFNFGHHHGAHDHRRSEAILLRRAPVTAIASVEVDDVALATDEYDVDPETGGLYRMNDDNRTFWAVSRKIAVIYTSGYAALPGPVQQAIFELVKMAQAARTRDPALRGENILGGLYSYSLFPATDGGDNSVAPVVAHLLASFRKIVVA